MTESRKLESILLAIVLVAAFHAIPWWAFRMLPARRLYESLGPDGYANLYDAATGFMPLVLCLGSVSRSGLTLGRWKGHSLKVLAICLLPVAVTAVIYPLTSKPFSGTRMGVWLISPLAQDLLFAGFLYGLFDQVFSGHIHAKLRIRYAVLIIPFFFALWHVPNFHGMAASYVMFQLLYTFVGSAWMLLARQLTGSIIPGVLTHMACNFFAWL